MADSMTLEQRIRKLVELADPDGTVTVRWLAQLLDEGTDAPADADDERDLMDLSVSDLMEATGRARSTVVGWINSGELDAWKFGHEWRITRAAWRDFLTRRRNPDRSDPPETSGRAVDLGSWRRVGNG